MQQFGFTSGVPADSQLIVLPLQGRTVASVIVATENGAFRVQVGSGETCISNQWGAKITLKEEKIVEVDCDHFVVKAKESISLQTKEYSAEATTQSTVKTPRIHLETNAISQAPYSNDGTVPTITTKGNIQHEGNITQQGSHTSTGDQVAGGISQINHLHTGIQPGNSNTGKPV